MDVLEAIAGEFPEGEEAEAKVAVRDDGSLLVAGGMPVDEFAERLDLSLDQDRDFETVAGLIIERMGRLPASGEHIGIGPWRSRSWTLMADGSTRFWFRAGPKMKPFCLPEQPFDPRRRFVMRVVNEPP